MADNKVVFWIIGVLFSCLSAFFWYDKKSRDKKLCEVEKVQNEHGSVLSTHSEIFVKEKDVRVIVKDEIAPLKENVQRLETSISNLTKTSSEMLAEVKFISSLEKWNHTSRGRRSTDFEGGE